MTNFILGISLTLNIVFFIGIIIYFKVKTFGLKKVQKEFANKYFVTDDELEDALSKL